MHRRPRAGAFTVLHPPFAQTATNAAPAPLSVARDVIALGKPRLTLLVVCTAAGGMWLAPGRHDGVTAIALLLGTTMVVAAANALNNFLERDLDGLMRRTRSRPLPAGRLDPWVAVAVGLGLPALSLPVLALLTNSVTAALAALALFTYVVIYTPMKQRSAVALFVGAVPGAIPPLMGWTAVTGTIDAGGLALFALLFCWQLPHFLAISLYLKDDYARGGLKVFALVHGDRSTRTWSIVTSVALIPVSLFPFRLGLAGMPYAVSAAVLGTGLAAYAVSGLWRDGGAQRWARNFFLFTLAYLSLLFAALLMGPR